MVERGIMQRRAGLFRGSGRTILRPSFVLTAVLGLRVFLLLMFIIGLVPSFRLQTKFIPVDGLVHMLMFDFLAIGMMTVFERLKLPTVNMSPRWGRFGKSFLPVTSAAVLLAFGIYGLLKVLAHMPQLTIRQYLLLGIQGALTTEIPWGKGLTIPHVALQVAAILGMVIIRGRVPRLLIILASLGALAVYSVVYMSRVMLIAPLVALLVLVVRNWFWETSVKRTVVAIFMCIILVLPLNILQQGFRDYEHTGKEYTESVVVWGMSRLLDYYVSTALYSAYIGAVIVEHTEPLEPRFYYGTPEYTNVGSLGQLWKSFGITYLFVLSGFWFVVGQYWRRFYQGYTDGLIVYPVMVYSLLEFPRIFEFTTITGLVRLALLVSCGWLFRNIPVRDVKVCSYN